MVRGLETLSDNSMVVNLAIDSECKGFIVVGKRLCSTICAV